MGKENYLTSGGERTSYFSYNIGKNLIYIYVLSFLSLFLTDVIGLTTGAVATLFLVARIWDAINDPILGSLVDRTNPKKGKFKPWVSATIVLLPIVTILVFWNIKGSGTVNMTYAYITYIIFGMIFTISDVPIFALVTSMTDNTEERVSILAIANIATAIAGIIGGILGAPLIDKMGFTSTTVIFMVLAFLLMVPLHFVVKERILHPKKEEVTLKSIFRAVFGNRYLLVTAITFLMIGGFNFSINMAAYFAKWNLNNLSLQAAIGATTIVPMLVLPPLLPFLIRKFGKRRIFILGGIMAIIFSIVQYFAGYENFTVFLILNMLKGVGMYMPAMMYGMFTADCSEYGAYKLGTRNEGVNFSIQTFTSKLSAALSGAIPLLLLGFFGYDGMAESQTHGALNGIWLEMTLLPLTGYILGLIVFYIFYRLDEKEVVRMIGEMERREGISRV